MLILIFDTEQEKCKFELIYEKYKKYVMYTIKRFICDDFLAEDLFHDVFIVIAKSFGQYQYGTGKRKPKILLSQLQDTTLSII